LFICFVNYASVSAPQVASRGPPLLDLCPAIEYEQTSQFSLLRTASLCVLVLNTAFLKTYSHSFYIRSFFTTSTSQHLYLYDPQLNNETHYAPLHQRINTNQTTTNTQVAMLAKFFLAPLFALAVKAVTVTSPTEGQNWGTSGTQTVSWDAVSTDPTSFSVVLVNDVSCRDETGLLPP
jgi:hypothetical protein